MAQDLSAGPNLHSAHEPLVPDKSIGDDYNTSCRCLKAQRCMPAIRSLQALGPKRSTRPRNLKTRNFGLYGSSSIVGEDI